MDYDYSILDDDVKINENIADIKIFLVVLGEISVVNDDGVISLSSGELFIAKPYTSAMLIFKSAKVIELRINAFSFNRFSFHKREYSEAETLDIKDTIKKQILDTITSIHKNDYFNADINVIKLINYIRIAGYYKPEEVSVNSQLLEGVLTYVNTHYKENLSLSKIAQHFFINSSYLSRIFSEEMNILLTNYINKIKIYNSAIMILSYNRTSNIWKEFGFKSYATYLNNFKNIFKVSPEKFLDERRHSRRKNVSLSNGVYDFVQKLASENGEL